MAVPNVRAGWSARVGSSNRFHGPRDSAKILGPHRAEVPEQDSVARLELANRGGESVGVTGHERIDAFLGVPFGDRWNLRHDPELVVVDRVFDDFRWNVRRHREGIESGIAEDLHRRAAIANEPREDVHAADGQLAALILDR